MFKVVSIPSSSGPRLNLTGGPLRWAMSLRVSIPSSSGPRLNPRTRWMQVGDRRSQSLLHQVRV